MIANSCLVLEANLRAAPCLQPDGGPRLLLRRIPDPAGLTSPRSTSSGSIVPLVSCTKNRPRRTDADP